MAEQLTLEMIQNSPRLRELAALPGDEVDNGKLIRNYSDEGDRMDLGEQLTEENINSSPTLQLLEAAPGKDWHPPRLDPEEAAKIAKSLETIN